MISVKKIMWPDIEAAEYLSPFDMDDFHERYEELRKRMEEGNFSHTVIYGDKEHFANFAYFSGVDVRFEETLIVIPVSGTSLIIHGNENEAYAANSPVVLGGIAEVLRYQSFSLINQPRGDRKSLKSIFRQLGINSESRLACIGWKYFTPEEDQESEKSLELPSYIVDNLRSIAGADNVFNRTDWLMHPEYGMRSTASFREIAFFEYTNSLASRQFISFLSNLKEGQSDFEAAAGFGFNGMPYSCHTTLGVGETTKLGFPSTSGQIIRRGLPIASNVSFWGSNVCKVGWIAEDEKDLPDNAAAYLEDFVFPYFKALQEWFRNLKTGVEGAVLYDIIHSRLADEKFNIFLNPGHLIHFDEWLNAPVYKGSEVVFKSRMVVQVDIIPGNDIYGSTRMEDGIVLLDENDRKEFEKRFPEAYARCISRRDMMIHTLGIPISDDIFPLSDLTGWIIPFFLNPRTVVVDQ